MADSDKQLNKAVEDAIRQMQAHARTMSQSVKEVQKFADALDDASNSAIDKATESIKKLLKNTGALTDLQVDSIKTAKQAKDILEKLALKQERLAELQAEHAAAIKAAGKAQGAKTDADIKLVKQLDKLGIRVENAADAAEALKTNMNKLKDLNNGVRDQTKFLSSASSKAGKAVEALGSKALTSVEKFASATFALEMAGKAIKEVYEQAVRLSDRGMLMAMRAINVGAIKLRLSAEEFEKLIQENMNIVSALGGGVKGIDRFTEELKFAGTGLEYLGKNASAVGAKNMQALMRAGMGPSSRNGVEGVYRKNLVEMNKQFKLFQAGFGDTIEDFSSYYDAVLQGDDIQQRMNSLDAKGIDLMMDEIRQRTENLRVMGLTTKQMEEMNKTLDAMYNPRKNNQTERMTQSIAFKNFYANSMQGASAEDQQVLMANQGLAEKYARAMQVGDSKTMQDLIGSKEGQQVAQALQRSRDQLMQKSIDTGQTYLPFMNNQWLDASGAGGQSWLNAGRTSLVKQNSGAPNQIDSPEVADWKKNVKEVTGEGSALAEAFQKLRAVVEQVTSVMSNPFTTAVTAFIAGVVSMSSTVRGALMNAIRGMVSAVSGGGAGFVAGIRGLLGGLLKLLKKIPAIGAALAGIEGAWDGLNTSTDDYYTRSGIDREASHVPQWMKDTGVRTLGVLSDVGAAAGRGISFGAWDPSKDFADKQAKAAQQPQPAATSTPASAPSGGGTNAISKVVSTGSGYNLVQRADGTVEKQSGARNWRNNNPGNIEYGDFAKSHGAIGSDGRFAIFPDYETGRKAKEALIFEGKNYSGKSLTDAIARYAPPSENNTGAYQNAVLAAVGGQNKRMSDYTPEERQRIMDAMQRQEGFKAGTTTQVAMANVVPPQTPTTVTAPSAATAATPATNAAAPTPAPTQTASAGQPTDSPLTELKRQTELLAAIASNTVKTPLVDHAGYKKNQEAAIASA